MAKIKSLSAYFFFEQVCLKPSAINIHIIGAVSLPIILHSVPTGVVTGINIMPI